MKQYLDKILAPYAGAALAVYGTGLNAERVLLAAQGLGIRYVLSDDPGRAGPLFCGYRVAALQEVLEEIDVILIAAVPRTANIIYERIRQGTPDRVHILDLQGHDLNHPPGRERIRFDNPGELIHVCVLPIVRLYMSHILAQLTGRAGDLVLFASRDGYLLWKIYCGIRLSEGGLRLPEAVYFYTSREAVTRSVPASEEDIRALGENMGEYRKSTVEELTERLFGVRAGIRTGKSVAAYMDRGDFESLMEAVLQEKESIFVQCEERRKGYKKYLDRLELGRYEKVWLVDLVTGGTACYGLGRLAGRDIELIALGVSAVSGRRLPDSSSVHALYKAGLYFGVGSPVSVMFSVLEMVLASDEGQLAGFDGEGHPLFKTGTAYSPKLLAQARRVMLEDFRLHPKEWIYSKESDKESAQERLGLLSPYYSDISAEIYSLFSFDDPLQESGPGMNALKRIRGERE